MITATKPARRATWVPRGLPVAAICLALGSSGLSASAADGFRRLSGKEITARFNGMEFTDEVHWALVFDRGGRLDSFSMGRAGTGSWRIAKDELCTTRPPDERRCYEVWASGPRVQLRSEPAIPLEGILQKPQKRP